MADKYQNKYRIPSARLQTWDYASNAAYFITICTAKRQHYFGQIVNEQMDLSEQAKIANQLWSEIPNHFSFVFLDEFVFMPNHMHGFIIIDNPGNNDFENVNIHSNIGVDDSDGIVETGHALSLQPPQQDHPNQTQQPILSHQPSIQSHPRFRNQGQNTISAMVGSFKSAVTKRCNELKLPFGWQSRFHDHIIREKDEFNRIKNYIISNPANWEQDKFFNSGS